MIFFFFLDNNFCPYGYHEHVLRMLEETEKETVEPGIAILCLLGISNN